jgi:hypothetical protein
MGDGPKVSKITCVSPLEDEKPENGNVDVHVECDDGSIYSLLVATPKNIEWYMDKEGMDYFFGFPPVLVRVLNQANIEKAIHALASEDGGRWLRFYGAIQE